MGCQSLDNPLEPKQLLSEDQMVTLLTDVAFVKASKNVNKKVFNKEKINAETYVINKHGIDSIVFAENNAWYMADLEKYKSIFTRVKANLEKSKIKYDKLQKQEDSIKRIKDSIMIAENKERVQKKKAKKDKKKSRKPKKLKGVPVPKKE